MSPSVSAVASAERIAEAKQFDDTTLGIKRSHGGRIKRAWQINPIPFCGSPWVS